MQSIVIGVDGSEGGKTALEFAAHEAAAHRVTLRVVCAWDVPYSVYAGGFVPPADLRETVQRDAETTARLAAEFASELEPSIYVEHEAVEGHPSEVLVKEAADALLIVVGSRGHGGFASMLLGSVSHEVAQHATCPVVIVPKTMTDDHLQLHAQSRIEA
jgi:nucleotide-binding universal stress UspA family protein